MSAARWANAAWRASAAPDARRLRRAFEDPGRAQTRLLLQTLRRNAETEAGRRWGFGEIRSLRQFQDRVPLVTYEDLADDVARIQAGTPNVLTADPVRLLEPTGGTSGGTKLVPFTRTLQRQIRRAVGPWVADLFARHPGAARGPAYWSVSPAVPGEPTPPGTVPVGFEDDAAYLSPVAARLAGAALAVPAVLRHVADAEALRYATLCLLLARADLALVSVWNPTFLTLLVAPLRAWGDRLARDLERGTLSADLPPAVAAALAPRLHADRQRAATLRAALHESEDGALHARLWPRLAVVSAWADAHARTPAADLARLFPHAHLQPKGLVATEGVVSIPLGGHEGGALALTSHVFEFLPDGGGRPLFAHEVEAGRTYEVVLTTGGGLVRYRLGDRVEVVGHRGRCPLVQFVGRAGPVSDRVGEKLHEGHVRAALEGLGLPHTFALVAPDGEARPVRYVLFVESPASDARLAEAACRLDAALGSNVHYAHARRLGQLGPLQAVRVTDGPRSYLDGCVALGQRLGDVKPAALHRDGGWAARFALPRPASRPRRPSGP